MMTNTHTLTETRKAKGGFTLIEVIAVLVLLGILTAIALPRYIDMTENARERAIDAGISELNGREALVWGNVLISQVGYTDDASVTGHEDYNLDLGGDYSLDGNTLTFQDHDVLLARAGSSSVSPAVWSRADDPGDDD